MIIKCKIFFMKLLEMLKFFLIICGIFDLIKFFFFLIYDIRFRKPFSYLKRFKQFNEKVFI